MFFGDQAMMRSGLWVGAILAALFTLPKPTEASANSIARLQCAARDYEAAAQLFHRSLCRCRRADDYTERLAERLACAASELSDAVHHGDRRYLLRSFDEVAMLHETLDCLLVRDCRRPDPIIVGLWRHQEIVYRRLADAMDAYRPECVMPPLRPALPVLPSVPRVTISSPSGIPWFLKAQTDDWHRHSSHSSGTLNRDHFRSGSSLFPGERFEGGLNDFRDHSGMDSNPRSAGRSTLSSGRDRDLGRDRNSGRDGIRYEPGRYGRIDNTPRR